MSISQMSFAVCGVVLLGTGCSQSMEGPLRVGDPLPEFQLTDFEGNKLEFRELANKVILINIWATWCRPCRDEMPSLSALADQLDPNRFLVIGISVDEDYYLADEFLRELHIGFSNYHDPKQLVVRAKLNNQGLPETLIVSANGILARRLLGERDWLDSAAMELLGQVSDNPDIANGQ